MPKGASGLINLDSPVEPGNDGWAVLFFLTEKLRLFRNFKKPLTSQLEVYRIILNIFIKFSLFSIKNPRFSADY
jgi:hypothetical protein